MPGGISDTDAVTDLPPAWRQRNRRLQLIPLSALRYLSALR